MNIKKIDNQWLTLHYRTIIGVVCLGLIVELLLSILLYKVEQSQSYSPYPNIT